MLRTPALILVLSLVTPLSAAENHVATPPDQYLARIQARLIEERLGGITADANPLAAKTFNMTARSFEFDVNPSPFVVNQGDSVTLNITVPSNDGSAVGHGFFLENYFEQFSFNINRGQTRQVTFVANSPGTFTYICTNSLCGSGHSLMFGTFAVNAVVAAAPTISSVSPSSGSPSGGTAISITGANFVNGATVKFGSTTAISTTVNSATSITTFAPAHEAGVVAVTVTNPDGQSGTFNSYTYASPALSISSISPSSGTTSGGTAVTISGASFESGATVTIGGVAATDIVVVSSTSITAKTPVGPLGTQIGRDVVVKNPDGKTATLTGGFTYTIPSPSITNISPATGTTVGGTLVTITGAGFNTGATVTFGGSAATSINVVNPTTIQALAPAHAAGSVSVAVTVGSANATSSFTYAVVTAQPKRRASKH